MDNSNLPEPELFTVVKGLMGPVFSAGLGVIWRRAEEIKQGKVVTVRTFFLDIPSVVGLGMISGSVALWLDLPLLWSMGTACVLGHVGTQWLLQDFLPRLLDKYFPRAPQE